MAVVALTQTTSKEEEISFFGCAPLGAYYPQPTIDVSSKPIQGLAAGFTKKFDDLIQNGGSDKYGPVNVNTTSFSVVIFGGDEKLRDDPIFFQYHYTSPEDQKSNENITLDTRFPVGDVSMVFTVYAWLAKMGEQWETPITKYLPELADVESPYAPLWADITIGALAGQVSGLSRESKACVLGEPCGWESFKGVFASKSPYFLPDTTPVVSYAAWQLLVFAMQREVSGDWSSILQDTILNPLNLNSSGVLSHDSKDVFAMESLNTSMIGEPGALSFVSSMEDLARAGHSMLASDILSPAITRRWLKSHADTSNLRNGVGRPWEVYRAGQNIRPIMDALTKAGTIGKYASYFGLTTDFNAGFAILAHDSSVEDRKLDLNVHADIVSEVLGYFPQIAAAETKARYTGQFKGENSMASFNTSLDGHGIAVQKLVVDGVNIKDRTAQKLGIKLNDLDFRVYPTNVKDDTQQQFVAVFQDKSALIDQGTPTCITWQEVGADAEIYVRFNTREGKVIGLDIPQLDAAMEKAD
ncbi:beta-lactamase family [Fusarium sporotrichioides]|uniref:Beta-lactamase family n=1 Tax=Fusarium sporotrichioides TaxID=5514 RepID=A0A395S9Q9_FUSSP|nr:beta-lactamase family [Fusarium sporotrichioides]